MFDKFKNAGNMGKLVMEARKLQKEIEKLEVTEERGRAKVVMSGDMKIKTLTVDGEEMRDLKDALNSALEKTQKKAAQKMQEMGGGLEGLLGGGR